MGHRKRCWTAHITVTLNFFWFQIHPALNRWRFIRADGDALYCGFGRIILWGLLTTTHRRYGGSRQSFAADLSPWKLNNLSSILFSGVLALPSKHWVFHGTAGMLVSGAALRKIQTSEPIQRALYFWKHAGPIIAQYKFTKWWLNVQRIHGLQREAIFEESSTVGEEVMA